MDKFKQIYTKKKSFVKYDDNHYIVYLNEEIVPDYVQDIEADKSGFTTTGYAYTGDFEDGGTIIEAKSANYDEFVSGLVRKRYSADRVEAITLNKLSMNKARSLEFDKEFMALDEYRLQCKAIAKALLGLAE